MDHVGISPPDEHERDEERRNRERVRSHGSVDEIENGLSGDSEADGTVTQDRGDADDEDPAGKEERRRTILLQRRRTPSRSIVQTTSIVPDSFRPCRQIDDHRHKSVGGICQAGRTDRQAVRTKEPAPFMARSRGSIRRVRLRLECGERSPPQ